MFNQWWEWIQTWPYSDASLLAAMIYVAYIFGYWIPNFFLFLVYHFDLFPEYKIQGSKWPPRDLVIDCLKHNVFEHTFLHPIIGYLFFGWYYGTFITDGPNLVRIPLPGLLTCIFQLVFMFLCADFSFYWLHRSFHTKYLYIFHKQHHTFKQTVGIASNYASRLEDVVVNLPSTFFALFFMRPHPFLLALFIAIRMEESCEEHSGYRIVISPWYWLRSPEHHDFHHSHNVGAYGTLPFWDYIMGTDKAYNVWKEQQQQKNRLRVTPTTTTTTGSTTTATTTTTVTTATTATTATTTTDEQQTVS